ncbi:MAG: VTT domain-containing protein [Kineosporiaceae bacterium]
MTSAAAPARPRRRLAVAAAVVALLAVNVAVYAALATEPAQRVLDDLSGWAYLGVFALALVANAGIMVGLPYNAVVLQMAATDDLPWLVAVVAAAGSALGESTCWWVGRRGSRALPGGGRTSRLVIRLRRVTDGRGRAFGAVTVFAAVPNHAFDVAGLAAGVLGIGYRTFLLATFTGRLLRFGLFAAAGPSLLAAWAALWS